MQEASFPIYGAFTYIVRMTDVEQAPETTMSETTVFVLLNKGRSSELDIERLL